MATIYKTGKTNLAGQNTYELHLDTEYSEDRTACIAAITAEIEEVLGEGGRALAEEHPLDVVVQFVYNEGSATWEGTTIVMPSHPSITML